MMVDELIEGLMEGSSGISEIRKITRNLIVLQYCFDVGRRRRMNTRFQRGHY